MVNRNVAVLQLVVTEFGDGAAQRGFLVPKPVGLIGVMLANHFLDRDGAGHGRLRTHGGCHRAKREPGSAPDRVEKGRAHLALVQQRFERLQMLDFLIHHMLDLRACRMVPEDRKLATIDLLRGTLTGMIDAKKAFDVAPSGARSGKLGHICLATRPPKINDSIATAEISRLNNMFQPAIDSPNRDHGTSSHRTTGVARS